MHTGVGWLPKAVGRSAFPIYFLAYERLIKAVEPAHASAVPEFDEVESRGHAG